MTSVSCAVRRPVLYILYVTAAADELALRMRHNDQHGTVVE